MTRYGRPSVAVCLFHLMEYYIHMAIWNHVLFENATIVFNLCCYWTAIMLYNYNTVITHVGFVVSWLTEIEIGSHGWLTVNAPEYNMHAHSTMQLQLLHNHSQNTISNYNTLQVCITDFHLNYRIIDISVCLLPSQNLLQDESIVQLYIRKSNLFLGINNLGNVFNTCHFANPESK